MQRDGRVATLGEALQRKEYFADALKCKCHYSFGAKGVMYSILPNTVVAANTIFV